MEREVDYKETKQRNLGEYFECGGCNTETHSLYQQFLPFSFFISWLILSHKLINNTLAAHQKYICYTFCLSDLFTPDLWLYCQLLLFYLTIQEERGQYL